MNLKIASATLMLTGVGLFFAGIGVAFYKPSMPFTLGVVGALTFCHLFACWAFTLSRSLDGRGFGFDLPPVFNLNLGLSRNLPGTHCHTTTPPTF